MSIEEARRITTGTQVNEIINYFGKCLRCGYPATASIHVTTYSDGTESTRALATCASPCGWTGPASPTTMSGQPPVIGRRRDTA
ncbi:MULTISPECIES: hypothetical protein [Nocardia]|uniref:Uncharacterized protein n=1 Tax=Nocardia aurea TaxID=2144174 RepID=A0ABV3FR83_9NOCA|nr:MULTISPECIES: hypothetical protein [Nocardia]